MVKLKALHVEAGDLRLLFHLGKQPASAISRLLFKYQTALGPPTSAKSWSHDSPKQVTAAGLTSCKVVKPAHSTACATVATDW